MAGRVATWTRCVHPSVVSMPLHEVQSSGFGSQGLACRAFLFFLDFAGTCKTPFGGAWIAFLSSPSMRMVVPVGVDAML
jgi:hypothetical protein